MVLGAGRGWAYQLHILQALKRKPDLFLCERLDVKAVFQCGKWGQGPGGPGAPLGGHSGPISCVSASLAAVLALKFPEAPTVKASCGFFVSPTSTLNPPPPHTQPALPRTPEGQGVVCWCRLQGDRGKERGLTGLSTLCRQSCCLAAGR